MNHPHVKKIGLHRRSFALLVAGLLASLATARADVWSFNLVGAPTALNPESPGGEYIRLTGGGTFDPDQRTVHASGSATIVHAGDHPAPPLGTTLKGTWRATGFDSFEADEGPNHGHLGGSLTIEVTVDLALGEVVLEGSLTVMEDGIALDFPGVEEYVTIEGTGSALFHLHGKAEAP